MEPGLKPAFQAGIMEFISLFGTPKKEPTVFEKIKQAVTQTKENFTERIQDLVEGQKVIDPAMLDELEAIMIGADIGVATTNEVLKSIRDQVSQQRRAFIRFFACEQDLSLDSPDAPLPDAVATGAEPLLVVGAMAGG